MITASQLSKDFGTFRAVDAVDLHVKKGECFGLLGPNGAGKSTIINMLYGVARRTSGDLNVFGLDPTKQSREIKKRLGVVTQDNALDESLTVLENMHIYSAFLGVPKSQQQQRISDLLTYMNLDHKASNRIQTLSGGMKRRLVFVRALLGNPELLILDEPTTGLDPGVRHLLWGKVQELKRRGMTILITTHYMHEAEILCDRVAIMNHGKIISVAAPSEMINKVAPGFVGVYRRNAEVELKLNKIAAASPDMQITFDESGAYLRAPTLNELVNLKIGTDPLQLRPSNLEDVFIKITGEDLSKNE